MTFFYGFVARVRTKDICKFIELILGARPDFGGNAGAGENIFRGGAASNPRPHGMLGIRMKPPIKVNYMTYACTVHMYQCIYGLRLYDSPNIAHHYITTKFIS
jgi:hypothetical protein